jgi:SSS family solute:Na+ symporter
MIYIIISLAIYVLIMAALYYRGYKKTKSTSDYLLAGKQIHPLIMALSYGATFISLQLSDSEVRPVSSEWGFCGSRP